MSDNKLDVKVGVGGYIALLFAILFFSGVVPLLAKYAGDWVKAVDFSSLLGSFGKIAGAGDFRGSGGSGAKDGFLFALTLVPAVMFALGVVEIIDWLGGLKAGQKILTPVLRPLLGIPGLCGLALISSLQSTDAGAAMSKGLKEDGLITEDEKTIFMMFQFTSDATITNFFSSGAAIIVLVTPVVPPIIAISFLVMFLLKIFAANVMRVYVKKFGGEA
ncbi:nucleoside recognition domain-containing protein [Deferribacterales bacterium RsTz2092]|nr:membrane protein [Deferribacterales bacterium]